MALSSNARASMARMAQGTGPEAAAARAAMGRLGMSGGGGGGGTNIVRRMPGAGGPRAIGAPRAIGGQRAIGPAAPRAQMVSMGPTRNRPPVRTPVSMGITRNRPAGAGAGVVDKALEKGTKEIGKKGRLLSNRGLAIGAGAAVIAGLAMNRRGDGTSSGRAGMTRY